MAGLLQAEYQRMLAKKAAQRRQEIEAARAAPAEEAAPGFRYRSHLVGAVWGAPVGAVRQGDERAQCLWATDEQLCRCAAVRGC